MQKPVENNRILKTKKILRETLVSLILEKDYDSIIVQDILNRANVRRSTFYLYYEDKDRLLMSLFSSMQESLSDTLEAVPQIPGNPSESLLRFSPFMFAHSYSHIAMYRAVAPKRGPFILHAIQETLAGFIGEEAKPVFKKRGGPVPSVLFVNFLASSFLSVMLWWIQQEKPVPLKKINAIFHLLVMPSVDSYLKPGFLDKPA